MVNLNFNPAILHMVRLAALGTVSAFSLIVLGVSAHWISVTQSSASFSNTYAAFALAVSILTILTVPPMIALGFVRTGAMVNWIIVELACLGVLAILWLASAGTTANAYGSAFLFCGFIDGISGVGCRETQAIQAFSHLNWLCLFFYTGALIALSFISRQNGVDVWQTTVKDGKFALKSSPQQGAYVEDPKLAQMHTPVQQVPVLHQSYPPQPPASGYPQDSYPQGGYPQGAGGYPQAASYPAQHV